MAATPRRALAPDGAAGGVADPVPLVLVVAAKEELPRLAAPVSRDMGAFLHSVRRAAVLLRELAVVRADRS